jgi:DNA-binding transcriptional ArsR family regulator
VVVGRRHEPQHATAGETVELLDRAGEEAKLEWERVTGPSHHGRGGADIVVGKSIHFLRVRIEPQRQAVQKCRSQEPGAILTGIERPAAAEERPRRKKPGHRIRLLAQKPDGLSSGEIAIRLKVPQNTMSTHMGILARAGLVSSERQSRSIIYSAAPKAVKAVNRFLSAG